MTVTNCSQHGRQIIADVCKHVKASVKKRWFSKGTVDPADTVCFEIDFAGDAETFVKPCWICQKCASAGGIEDGTSLSLDALEASPNPVVDALVPVCGACLNKWSSKETPSADA